MGMYTYVKGFREEDEHYKKMEAAYYACVNAHIDPPQEVMDYFQDADPKYGYGKDIDISTAVTEFSDSDACQDGIEIDLEKLPTGVKKIRFVNSY